MNRIIQLKTQQMCNYIHWHESGVRVNYRNALYMQYTPFSGQCPS